MQDHGKHLGRIMELGRIREKGSCFRRGVGPEVRPQEVKRAHVRSWLLRAALSALRLLPSEPWPLPPSAQL